MRTHPYDAERWARNLARLRPEALTVLVDISNKCNLRCRMCYFSYDSVFHRKSRFMTSREFERLAAAVSPYSKTVILSAGSEPLTNPHFVEILEVCSRFGLPGLKFLTNAQSLTPDRADACIEHGVAEIHLSIDGATRETYEYIRRGARFDRLVENIDYLNRRKREAGSPGPLLLMNVTLMQSNLEELAEFPTLARRLGVEQIAYRHLMPYRGLEMERESLANDKTRANFFLIQGLEAAAAAGVRVASYPDLFDLGEPSRTRPRRSGGDPPPPSTRGESERIGTHGSDATDVAPEAPDVVPVPAHPFGHIDLPEAEEIAGGATVLLQGWALDRVGIMRVQVAREPVAGDSPEAIGPLGLVSLGNARILNGARPDVMAKYRGLPLNYRAGWRFRLDRTDLPSEDGLTHVIHVLAHSKSGEWHDLGTRRIRYRASQEGEPHLFCRKPFDCVYVDAFGDVYPYPDCQTVDPCGRLDGSRSFEEIWFSEGLQRLRRRIIRCDPPDMCRTCPDFINREVDDSAYFEPREVESVFRLPVGAVDAPDDGAVWDGTSLLAFGWCVAFGGISRVEIVRDSFPGETSVREDGFIHVADARLGFPSPEVAKRYPRYPECDRAGWGLEIPRTALPEHCADVRFRVIAYNAEGGKSELGRRSLRTMPSSE